MESPNYCAILTQQKRVDRMRSTIRYLQVARISSHQVSVLYSNYLLTPEHYHRTGSKPTSLVYIKKGDKHQAENYRPISLTCVSCKLLEHIICRHLMKHLEDNNILTDLNHGFRSGYSCESQLLVTMEDLLRGYDSNTQIDCAILDFSKVFDTVPHKKLLHKLSSYGINGRIHSWLTQFLTARTMQVVLEGQTTRQVTVDSGVPQGTVLGPILFLCHINDLPACVPRQDCSRTIVYSTVKLSHRKTTQSYNRTYKTSKSGQHHGV